MMSRNKLCQLVQYHRKMFTTYARFNSQRYCIFHNHLRAPIISYIVPTPPYYREQRSFTTSTHYQKHWLDPREGNEEDKEKEMVVKKGQVFEEEKERNKETFHKAVKKYFDHQVVYRKHSTEFAYASMQNMKLFGCHKDLESYKLILSLFPQGPMVTTSVWQVEFQHYPKQQNCVVDIINFMEENGVMADDEMGNTIVAIFGDDSHAFRRYRKHMYWIPKFKNSNPFPVPFDLPDDDIELAKIALKRMAVDLRNELSVNKTDELEKALDKTFIVHAMAPAQKQLIREQPTDKPIFVEGPFMTWTRDKCLYYFILRADTAEIYHENEKLRKEQEENQELFDWSSPFIKGSQDKKSEVARAPSVHEQPDGTILSMCITGTGSRDSLMSWLTYLQGECPQLAEIPVVFKIRSPERGLKVVETETDRKAALSAIEGDR